MPLKKPINYAAIDRDVLAYTAGLFDGEGCAYFARNKIGYGLVVATVSNTNIDVLKFLQETFGGNIFIRRKYKNHPNWKNGGAWRTSNSSAVDFLRALLPWLIIKKRQAEAAVAWQALKPGWNGTKKTPDDIIQQIDLIEKYFKFLNARGENSIKNPMKEQPIKYEIEDLIFERKENAA